MSYRRMTIAAATVLALGACNTAHRNIGMEDTSLGEAVKYDAAIQTINPDPVYPAGMAQPGAHGDVGAKAVKRYRTFLASGGSQYPIDLLKGAGVDMTTSEPLDLTIRKMDRVMDEIEKLIK